MAGGETVDGALGENQGHGCAVQEIPLRYCGAACPHWRRPQDVPSPRLQLKNERHYVVDVYKQSCFLAKCVMAMNADAMVSSRGRFVKVGLFDMDVVVTLTVGALLCVL